MYSTVSNSMWDGEASVSVYVRHELNSTVVVIVVILFI